MNQADDGWRITESGIRNDGEIDRLGGALLVGNGYLGYRGTLEEDGKTRMPATIVAGLYDRADDRWREPVNMPNTLQVRIVYRGRSLDARTGPIERHMQALDLFRAAHERRTSFLTEDGNVISIRSLRFASLESLHLICLKATVEAARDCEVSIHASIDGDVWDLNGPHLEAFDSSVVDDVASLVCRTREAGLPVAVSQRVEADWGTRRYRRQGQRIETVIDAQLSAGSPRTFEVYAALHTGRDGANPLALSRALSRNSASRGFDSLFEGHCALWAARWKRCNVRIDGDAEAELALRFSMYHLLAVAPAHVETASIPARGFSGQMYKGAVFWDTEIFMLPFFAHAFPRIARNLLRYRFHTLDGARRKAREYGFRGAFYAWESQDTGDDACTLFNITDVFTNRPMRTYFRDKQVHISADVAYAVARYVRVTGDHSILLDGGAEVVYECGRFLLSYLYFSREKNRYEILDVTGPDEYHERVHNNAYTNWMTAHAFDACLEVSAMLQERFPAEAQALLEALDFQRDLEAIRDARRLLFQPGPDPTTSLVPQFDGYFELEDSSIASLLRRKLHPHEYLGGANGLAASTQVIKQADVVLGLWLAGEGTAQEVKAANWEYYEPRTEHGSSLSACVYALVAAEIGKREQAFQYFMKSATADLKSEQKSHVGPLYIGGTHPAASGGAWMAAVFGLCGIDISGNTIAIEPRLPDHWREVSLALSLQGQDLAITLSSRSVCVRRVSAESGEIVVRAHGQSHSLPMAGALTISASGSRCGP
jgi:trehalose/maltose hydrolase-like predicted phosphorylase